MAIGRNDNYVQQTFTEDTFRKRRKREIQRLDRVSCLDMEIQVLPNLGIAVDRVSCPDMDIGVLTTRFPRVSCFEKPTRSVPETWGRMYNVLALRN